MKQNKSTAKDAVQTLILSSPNYILTSTLQDISHKIFYSEASIIKALKQLGYPGFKALKKKLYVDGIKTDAVKTDLLLESLLATDRYLDQYVDWKKIRELIWNKSIVFQGFGFQRQLAIESEKLFIGLVKDVHSIEWKEELGDHRESTLICLTTNGNSEILKNLMIEARSKNIKIIIVTGRDNKVSEYSDFVIPFTYFFSEQDINFEKNILIRFIITRMKKMLK